MRAVFKEGKKKIFLCWSRRAGKDVVCFNILFMAALSKPGIYYYCLPEYSHGRKVIWDTLLSNGKRLIDFIAKPLIAKINEQQMKIQLVNNSIIQIVGSDKASRTLVGTNPQGVIFSEWQVSNAESYEYIRPALLYNGGFAIFNGTPRGPNHFYEMYNIAREASKNPLSDWFCSYLTCYDTNHIPRSELLKEKASMSPDKFMQEYECSFSAGQIGVYYGRQMDQMHLDGRIGVIPYETSFDVHVSLDLGVSDPTCVIFFQICGAVVRVIDYEEFTDKGLDHLAKLLNSKDYKYGKIFAPLDIKVREIGAAGAISRLETARNLGMNLEVVENLPLEECIEITRMSLSKWYIDEKKCARLIQALENYRREFDEEKKVYRDKPRHDWASHPADAARMLAISLPRCEVGTTQEELDRMFLEAKRGPQSDLPPVFRNNRYGPF